MTITPICPADIATAHRLVVLPDQVIATWNKLLGRHYNGATGRAVVNQTEALAQLSSDTGHRPEEVQSFGWLDIEAIYRERGWLVEYTRPEPCAHYGRFTFTGPRPKA